MSHYPPQEPQRQQSYDPQQAQPTFVSRSSVPSSSGQPYGYSSASGQEQSPDRVLNASSYPRSSQIKGAYGMESGGKLAGHLWHMLIQFLGGRGLVVASGGLLSVLAFFLLPYYSDYSGYFLAALALDDKWWMELVLAVVPLVMVIAQRIVPPIKPKRGWSLVLAGSGVLGLLMHYALMEATISSNDWRLGTWSYFLGMALVMLGGLLLSIQGKRA